MRRPELHTSTEDATSMLLLDEAGGSVDDDVCIALLGGDDSVQTNVLEITTSVEPDARLWLLKRGTKESPPERISVVDARGSETAMARKQTSEAFSSATIELMSEEADLVEVSAAIGRQIGAWESTSESTRVCLYSLTTLLDTFGQRRVASFVRAVNDLCAAANARTHHHLDPTQQSAETVDAFRPLYDLVIERSEDGEWAATEPTDEANAADAATQRSGTPAEGVAPDLSEFDAIPIPHSFDMVIDSISAPRRRTVLYLMRDRTDPTISLDELVTRVVERETAIPSRTSPASEKDVRFSLVHRDLPKLEEVGIVSYDPDERLIRYSSNPALESCLEYLELLELG